MHLNKELFDDNLDKSERKGVMEGISYITKGTAEHQAILLRIS